MSVFLFRGLKILIYSHGYKLHNKLVIRYIIYEYNDQRYRLTTRHTQSHAELQIPHKMKRVAEHNNWDAENKITVKLIWFWANQIRIIINEYWTVICLLIFDYVYLLPD